MERCKAFFQSQSLVYILLALFCLLLVCLSDAYDYDLYARLIVGEYFFSHGTVSYDDFLSFTNRHLWYDHEWGSSVVFYAFLKLFGPFGLVLIQAITMFVTSYFVIKIQKLQKHSYPTSLFFMIAFLILYSHQNPNIVRCHMFSFMFFSMFLYFLEKTKKNPNSNILWFVPLIIIIWNNLHGGVVSGLGIIFVYMIAAILSKKPWLKYLYVLIVSTPLLVINPYGVDYLNFLYSANTKNREYITEWWGVFIQRHAFYYYPIFGTTVFVILLSILNSFSKKNFDIAKIFALILTAYLGITHVKLFSLTMIVIASLYYNDIVKLFSHKALKFCEKVSYVLVVLSLFYIPFTNPALAKTNGIKFPVLECEFLKLNNIRGNIVTAFGLGSFVSYKLYDQNLIYMDGRYEEVYYDEEFDYLIKYEKAEDKDWDKLTKIYKVDILMPEKTSPVYEKLQEENSEWIKIYEGFVCGIFVKKGSHRSNYLLPVDNKSYFQKIEFDTGGKFGKIG